MSESSQTAERIERAALEALHRSAPAQVRERLGLGLDEVDGALVAVAAGEPGILLNRTLGLGLAAPATKQGVRRICRIYEANGVGRYFIHRHPDAQPADLVPWLREARLAPARRWMKFSRGTLPPPAAETDLRIEEIGPAHAATFGRIVADAFDLGHSAELLAGVVGQPGWHAYLSFDGDAAVGAGALYLHGTGGWLDMGATKPAGRGRGSQRAILARRIADAIDAGCEHLFTTTGEEAPGDPQHSYHNIQWAGFRESYLRDNYAPPR